MGLLAHPDATKIAEYRRKAIDASARAAVAKDDFMRQSWETIAQSYQDMADRLEHRSKE